MDQEKQFKNAIYAFTYFRFQNCSHQTGLTGEHLPRKRKIVMMILFSFEVDTLEIALREQADLVDRIFLVESRLTHKMVSMIPL